MKKLIYRIFEFLMLILVLSFFISGVLNYNQIQDFANKEILKYRGIGIFIIGFLTEFIPQYVPPHIGIVSAPLINFNLWYAFLLVALGSTLGSIAGFELGYLSRKKSDLKKSVFGETKIKKIENGLEKHARWFLFIAAISPIPYIPIIFGNLHIRRKTFFIYGIIPRVIGLFILTFSIYLGFY